MATPEVLSSTADGDIAAIVDLAAAGLEPRKLPDGEVRLVVVPDGYRAVVVDTEVSDVSPRRRVGFVEAHTPGSFIAQVNRWKTPDTVIWFDARPFDRSGAPTIVAVFNPHPAGPAGDEQADSESEFGPRAGWHDNGARLMLRADRAYEAWMTLIRRGIIPQVDFAEHLEQYARDIVEPDGATVFEVAKTLQAKLQATFSGGTRLATGDQSVAYSETTEAKAGAKGDLAIPTKITLMLSPFHAGIPVRFDAFVRYRITDGKLTFSLVLDRPDERLDAAAQVIADEIEARTGVPVFMGVPLSGSSVRSGGGIASATELR